MRAYEDLRHLLKHKRSYARDALTPKERKILARKSLVASIWLATGKKVHKPDGRCADANGDAAATAFRSSISTGAVD